MSRFGWPPNIAPLEPLTSQRPPFKPANEQQEAVLATADWLIARCDEEIDRLRSAEVGRRRVMNHQHIFRLLSTADTTARCECGEVREHLLAEPPVGVRHTWFPVGTPAERPDDRGITWGKRRGNLRRQF